MAKQDDLRDDDRADDQDNPRFGPSGWPSLFQFAWALLVDRRRMRSLVFLIVVIVLALLALKGAYAGVIYNLAQRVPHWVATALLAGGVGGSIMANFAFSVYRKARRIAKNLARDRAATESVERAAAESAQKESAKDNDHDLGEPGQN
jgi:hypothetical protein